MGADEVLGSVASVAGAIAVTNLIKKSVDLGRWAALVSVLVAMGLNVAVSAYSGEDLFIGAMRGLIMGLAASGLWDLKPDKAEVLTGEINTALVADSDAETEIPVDEWGYSEDDVVEVVESDGDEEAIVD